MIFGGNMCVCCAGYLGDVTHYKSSKNILDGLKNYDACIMLKALEERISQCIV